VTLEVKIKSFDRASVTFNDFHETRYRLYKKFRASTNFEKICSVTVTFYLRVYMNLRSSFLVF